MRQIGSSSSVLLLARQAYIGPVLPGRAVEEKEKEDNPDGPKRQEEDNEPWFVEQVALRCFQPVFNGRELLHTHRPGKACVPDR